MAAAWVRMFSSLCLVSPHLGVCRVTRSGGPSPAPVAWGRRGTLAPARGRAVLAASASVLVMRLARVAFITAVTVVAVKWSIVSAFVLVIITAVVVAVSVTVTVVAGTSAAVLVVVLVAVPVVAPVEDPTAVAKSTAPGFCLVKYKDHGV